MQRNEGVWQSPEGLELFERSWRPAEPKATVVIVHGFAEHSGRYDHVGERLAKSGYAVHALDLRGHGRSQGRPVFIRSIDEHVADVDAFLERIRQREPGRPLFILGHSMGGLIVAYMLSSGERGLRGTVLSGAALRATRTSSRLLERVLRFLGRFFPRLPLPKIDAADVSRDPDVVQRYDSDPLVFRGNVPAGTARAMIHAARAVVRDMEAITLPILILHGSEDGLVHPDGSRDLHERVASADKALKVYEGLYHEIMNEPERDLVLADIVAWLDKRAT